MFGQGLELQLRVGGVVLGVAGGEGYPLPRQGQGIDGKEQQEIALPERGSTGRLDGHDCR